MPVAIEGQAIQFLSSFGRTLKSEEQAKIQGLGGLEKYWQQKYGLSEATGTTRIALLLDDGNPSLSSAPSRPVSSLHQTVQPNPMTPGTSDRTRGLA